MHTTKANVASLSTCVRTMQEEAAAAANCLIIVGTAAQQRNGAGEWGKSRDYTDLLFGALSAPKHVHVCARARIKSPPPYIYVCYIPARWVEVV